ncbi:MAG: hypothetical protein HYZ18_06540 [Pseudogulbenkiania sp.]|nr:hypothetical protein [Pseudogulbenkiania sp.]
MAPPWSRIMVASLHSCYLYLVLSRRPAVGGGQVDVNRAGAGQCIGGQLIDHDVVDLVGRHRHDVGGQGGGGRTPGCRHSGGDQLPTAPRVKDERVLKLIRRYLEAGMRADGVVSQRSEGTPQGGPLSPLLSNILLTDLDRELERRGHRFCRCADDCNIYVGSHRAGEHLMTELTAFLEGELHLKVNHDKSAVARPWERKFLGYSFTWHKQTRLKVADSSLERLKAWVRELTRQDRGRSILFTVDALSAVLRGWMSYFRLTQVRGVLEELDGWIRRKLRCILWRQWKRPFTRARMLQGKGLTEERAWRSATNQRGPWWNAGASHMNETHPKRWFDLLGLVSLQGTLRRFQSTQ